MALIPAALRDLARRPATYLIDIVTIATGVGAAVAMFSIYSATVLRPMSVEAPEELVAIQAANARVANVPTALSWLRFDHSLRGARSFSRIAAYDADSASLSVPGEPPERIPALRVSEGFFPLLGVQAGEGRLFTSEDDAVNGPAVCVLSHQLWQTRFGGAPVTGRTIDLDGRAVEIIGVLASRLTPPWAGADIFLPRVFESSTMNAENVRNGASFLSVIGRLGPGVTLSQAQAELDTLAVDYAARFAGRTDAANSTVASSFLELLIGNRRQIVGVLLGSVVAILLVACTNASTLFLGRLLARRREVAVRQALGASRPRLIAAFMLESLGLAFVAGVTGLGLAWGLLRAAAAWLSDVLPAAVTFGLDGRALAAATAVVLFVAVAVGLLPALYATRRRTTPLLTFARTEGGASGGRVRSMLVLAQVAICCVLLVGAALLVTSLVALQRTSPGFDTDTTAAGLLSLSPQRHPTPERQAAFAVDVVDQLGRAPGIRGAAVVFGLPLGDEFTFHQYVVAGRPIPPPSERERAGIRLISEGYFEVMGIRMRAGRAFTSQDRAGAPLVCIVNESLARRMFAGDPIGQSILRGREANLRYEIVGVVEDIRTYGIRREPVDEVFYPIRQLPWPHFALVASATGDPSATRRVMEAAVSAVDPTQPLARFASMRERLDATRGSERAMATVTTIFAVITLLIAVVGLYTTVSHDVASRTAELGVRMALGATPSKVVRLVLRQGMTIVGAGMVIGVALAALGSTYLSGHLFAVDPRDPRIFAGVAAAFAGVAFMACVVPSRRAARLDPLRALRHG
jgi:putative ABC transport system permease protein